MILPIVAYGDTILRQPGKPVTPDYPELQTLIENLYQTLYNASGVGLAAPQVGLGLLLFVVDTAPMAEYEKDQPELLTFKRTFINAEILEETGEPWAYTEGCLSIPHIREDVQRKGTVRLKWLDENFQPHEETFTGLRARVIQHEYDHTMGKLFVDYLSPLKKTLLRGKLLKISKGQVDADYPMRFPGMKRVRV